MHQTRNFEGIIAMQEIFMLINGELIRGECEGML